MIKTAKPLGHFSKAKKTHTHTLKTEHKQFLDPLKESKIYKKKLKTTQTFGYKQEKIY